MNQDLKKYLQPGRNNLILVYVLYLCGVVVPLFALIGVGFVFANKDIDDEMLASHYTFLLRTFWIALILLCVATITSVFIIGIIIYPIAYIWYILRVVIGCKYLVDGNFHPNPLTFFLK